MISGLIIYSGIDKDKNTWFIDECIKRFADKGVSLIYKDENEVKEFLENNSISFAIYRGRDYKMVEFLEDKGIRCFNNSFTNKIANDKLLTFEFLSKEKIPVIPSFSSLEEISSFPLVMKSVDGHGGNEVFLVNSKQEVETFRKENKRYVYQKYCPNEGDLRLYALNKAVIGAVYRHSKEDFRSNFSLGGEASVYEPNKEIVDIAIKVASSLNADYIGVDFINIDGKWCVNEIEDPVGARMLFKTSNIDVVELLVRYIYSLVMVD